MNIQEINQLIWSRRNRFGRIIIDRNIRCRRAKANKRLSLRCNQEEQHLINNNNNNKYHSSNNNKI